MITPNTIGLHFVELIGFAGAVLCLYGQTQRIDRMLKVYMALGFGTWTLHYSLIGGASGMAAVFAVAALRQAVLVYWHPANYRERILFAGACVLLAFGVAFRWWSGWTTIIALVGLCWSSYVFTYLSGVALRTGLVINNLIWGLGAVVASSVTGICYQTIATMLVGWSAYSMWQAQLKERICPCTDSLACECE